MSAVYTSSAWIGACRPRLGLRHLLMIRLNMMNFDCYCKNLAILSDMRRRFREVTVRDLTSELTYDLGVH